MCRGGVVGPRSRAMYICELLRQMVKDELLPLTQYNTIQAKQRSVFAGSSICLKDRTA